MAAGDGPWSADYEMSRISTSYAMLKTLQPWYSLCVVVSSAFHVKEGVFTVWTFSCALMPHLVITTMLMLTRGRLKEVERRNLRSFGIGLQVFCVVVGFATRAAVGSSSEGFVDQHRVYMYITLVQAFYAAGFGYVPGRYFYGCIVPSFILSWNIFHYRVGYLKSSVFIVGFVTAFMMMCARKFVDDVNLQAFLTSLSLKQTQRSLEQVMSAQQGMLSSFFDASCVCRETGEITRATPQIRQLLACDDFPPGLRFPQLAPPGQEQERLRRFMANAWEGAVAKPTMIQTSLRPPATRSAAEDVAGGTVGLVEARIYCIRLPDVSKATVSMSLWATGGLFLGLQDVTSSASAQDGQAEAGEGAPDSLDAFLPSRESHGLIFDAGTPTLDVLKSSPVFAQAFGVGHSASLLDIIPERVRRSFDNWVYDQVQHASVGQLRKSRSFIRDLTLMLPPGRGLTLEAKRAWLEFDDREDPESCSIPVGLRLSGVSMKASASDAARPQEDKLGQLSCIDSIPEEEDDQSLSDGGGAPGDDDDVDADGDANTEVSSIIPEDSASQSMDYVRLRTSRSRGHASTLNQTSG